MNCGDCKFFAPPREDDTVYDRTSDDFDEVPDEHGRCYRIIHGNGDEAPKSAAVYNAEPAFVTDGSGYAATLRVLPSFFCALHTVKS